MVQLLDMLFPRFCVGCGRIGTYFCSSCKNNIHPITQAETICPVCEHSAVDGVTHSYCKSRYSLDCLVSFFHYDDVIKKAIKEIKYRFVSDLVSTITKMGNIERLVKFSPETVIVPISLHPNRLRFRGFNQSSLIASSLSQRLDFVVIHDMLVRIRETKPQVEMKERAKRMQNMKDVFAVNTKYLEHMPLSILLVDDVFTTGATLSAGARVLKQAGSKLVMGLTLAR